MKTISISSLPGFEEWKDAARQCLAENIPPDHILWRHGDAQQNLFAEASPVQKQKTSFNVPKAFIDLASAALCHQDERKYALSYRILWRLLHENKNLLKMKTDHDIFQFEKMVKAVRRDAYKITAFLRFREINHEGTPHFIAKYEPEHYTLERVMPFFTTRFKNMRWSILTPYRAAHWDGDQLEFEDNPDLSLYPKDDQTEQYWLTYYASIFNPARLKKKAMLAQMPMKYWKNMPETVLINNLLKTAETRTRKMILESKGE